MSTNPTSNVPENILKQARALLAMKNSTNENEAFNAASLLAKLMGKYNFDELHLEDPNSQVAVTCVEVEGKYKETWRLRVYATAAEMFYCTHFFDSVKGNRNCAVVHSFVGEAHNVVVAVEMAKYFEETINRLANTGARTATEAKESHTRRHQYIRTFRLAAADRLRLRVDQWINAAKKGELTDESGSRLPALLSLYDRQDQLFEDWCKAQGLTFVSRTNRDQYLSDLGKKHGTAAGDSIPLTTQIKAGSAAAANALPSTK